MVARGYASLSFLYSAAEAINELDVPAYIYLPMIGFLNGSCLSLQMDKSYTSNLPTP